MSCPNCGASYRCYCTWREMQRATEIKRRRAAEYRRSIGKPTVAERELEDCRKAERTSK